ncbi:MAG TPA: carbon-nitrogen hydrolase family protein [Burkholderiaceae bacterium]
MHPERSNTRIAIAQISMHWSTAENTSAIMTAMHAAHGGGAWICAFSELAVTGFHRNIATEALPHVVQPAIDQLQELCAKLSLAIAVGAPTFTTNGSKFNSHLLINESGRIAATIAKRGLTEPEATFFERGSSRPVGDLQGLRCTAVICREIEDFDQVSTEVPSGSADVVFLPGALRPDPAKPLTDPPEFVTNAQRLAAATKAYIVQTNWPNALNRPEESVDGGQSAVISPSGELMFRLPRQSAGIGIFSIGDKHFEWLPQ